MTRQQVEWMQQHPDFQFYGRPGGMEQFTQQTCVRPDGSSYRLQRGHRPADGEIHVGIRRIADPAKGLITNPRQY